MSSDTLGVLADAGWYSGRFLKDAESWYSELCGMGYPENQFALEFLRELGDLVIGPVENEDAHFVNYEPLNVDPFSADVMGVSFLRRCLTWFRSPAFLWENG
ncbi:SUKH-3 domain-containing protein [Nocardiopsis alba]|uniref:SUKH-3 domain-containing protein n=1 Tax=Nocardiopsis alba TaxID=53437 RepID=UPI0036711FAE